ncbi:MAG: dedD [Gammaproteobacteria bacterium]|jgi:cell division septation protein DedD|nr:dedD [Gammaproteobacteria bacterium]
MEKRKMQRIIGISIVIALVIISMPLLFSKKEMLPQEKTALATPSDQQPVTALTSDASPGVENPNNTSNTPPSSATSIAQDNDGVTPAVSGDTPLPSATSISQDNDRVTPGVSVEPSTQKNTASTSSGNPIETNTDTSAPASSTNISNPNNTSQQTTTLDTHPNVKYTGNTVEVTPAPTQQANTQTNSSFYTGEISPTAPTEIAPAPQNTVENTLPRVSKPLRTHKKLVIKKKNFYSEKNLTHLKKTAWVLQMGSFKEKSNARRLVNQLRNAGFKAFPHEVTSTAGLTRTRVYIGPEFKKASALQLSTRVERAVKLRGLVVPYKPVAL